MTDVTFVNDTILKTNITKEELNDILNRISNMDYIEKIQLRESASYRYNSTKKINKKRKGRKYSYHFIKDIYTITENDDSDICNVVISFNFNDISVVTEVQPYSIHITINDMNDIYDIVFCKYTNFFKQLFNHIKDFFIRR